MTRERSETDAAPQLRARLVEAVFACATVLGLCVVVLAAGERQASPAAFLAVTGFGALALLGAVAPRTALAVTVIGIFAYYAADFPPLGMVLPAVAALFLAASAGRTVWAAAGAVILLGVSTYFRLVDADPAARFTGYEYVTELALAAAAIALGAVARLARDRRAYTARIARLVAAEERHRAEQRAQEARIRIARDLHDTVGHQLTVVSLHTSVAEEALGAPRGPDTAGARAALDRVREANSATLGELRQAVRTLRADDPAEPVIGGDDPLAIAALARTARDSGLDVTVDASDAAQRDALLAPERSAAIRAILTEATTNVLRHARARSIWLTLAATLDGVRVDIADDGVGCDPVALSDGHGIAGMRERAAGIGADLRIATGPGHGCRVTLTTPRDAPREGDA